MDDLKSAEWVETRTQCRPPQYSTVGRVYLRFDPPAMAWCGESGSHDLVDERGHLHTAAAWENCALYPRPHSVTREGLLRKVLAAGLPVEEVDGHLEHGAGTWRSERVDFDGRAFIKYSREYAKRNFRVSQATWFDPVTRRVLRREGEEADPETGRLVLREVCDQYRYNQEAPEGTFTLPPPDKPLIRHDRGSLWPDLIDTLPAAEREEIERAIRSSDAGWAAGDFAEFARCWRFGSVPRLLPAEADWKTRVEQQSGLWQQWNSQIVEIRRMDRLWVATASHSFRSVERSGVLQVKAGLHLEWGWGVGTWDGDVTFQVTQEPEGYRILHWECPFEEIRANRGR